METLCIQAKETKEISIQEDHLCECPMGSWLTVCKQQKQQRYLHYTIYTQWKYPVAPSKQKPCTIVTSELAHQLPINI